MSKWYLRLMSALLAWAVVLAGATTAFAEESLEEVKPDEDFDVQPVAVSFGEKLPARSAILMEQNTGKILFEDNADEQLPPASVTKIMTMLLTMEALESGKINLDDQVVTSEYANSMGGSQIWLKVGEAMTVDHLLKAVAVSSANDAAVQLGEHIAGSNDAFVDQMNNRAEELGMENTRFFNCTGLDEEGHLTTARDIAIMSRELMKHPRITEYATIWMDSLRNGETELVNTNKLIRFYQGATGLKTGTTNGAGSCLSATATRDGLSLVAVVMGCPTSDERFASARGLLDFGFANYTSVTLPPVDDQLKPVTALHGVDDSVEVRYDDPGSFVVEKGVEDRLTQEVSLPDDVEAPVEEGQILGKVDIVLEGEILGSYDLEAASSVERLTLGKAYGKLLRSLLTMCRIAPPPELSTPADPPGNQPAEEPSDEPEPCACGEDTCYCQEIGDVCGCTKGA